MTNSPSTVYDCVLPRTVHDVPDLSPKEENANAILHLMPTVSGVHIYTTIPYHIYFIILSIFHHFLLTYFYKYILLKYFQVTAITGECKLCNITQGVGYLADRCDCGRFYQCQQLASNRYSATNLRCPQCLHWNAKQLTCSLPVTGCVVNRSDQKKIGRSYSEITLYCSF